VAVPPRSRRTFVELWMQIRSMAYALMQLLALQLWESFPLLAIAPWRKGAMITAGSFVQWLRMLFIGLPVHDAYDPKSGQFLMPFPGQDQRLQCWSVWPSADRRWAMPSSC